MTDHVRGRRLEAGRQESRDVERPTSYVTGHLQKLQHGLGYTRLGYARKAWHTFRERFPGSSDAAVLEIGPGGGELVELLLREHHYRDVTVIDREREAIEIAERLGARAILADDLGGALAEQGARFDVVLMLHVLEHLPKAETISVLTACRRVLVPDGVLLIEVPNMGDPLNGLYVRYADFTHEVGFTEESLEYVLRSAGFREVDFLNPVGATGRLSGPLQRAARKALHLALRVMSLPNGRQMRRRIDPVLAVCARA